MTAGVTLSRARCAGCGALLTGRRRQARTCSHACRQRAYRARVRERVTVSLPVASGRLRLTCELREALRLEVDRRRRTLMAENDRAEAEHLLSLLADGEVNA
jgi:hypothetical protein